MTINKIHSAVLFAVCSTSVFANQAKKSFNELTPLYINNTAHGEAFSVKLKDGSTLNLIDIDGLGYLGDMILGHTDELKRYGLDIAAVDGISSVNNANDMSTPSSAIRYPTSGYKWPQGEIPYQIDGSLSSSARQDFLYAVDHWNSKTNINLVPRSSQNDYINIVNGGGCSSWIGRSGGRQTLTLASNCGRGAAVHEIGHAVGLFHEQTRSDRDSYINILWQNIQSSMSYNFQKITRAQGQNYGPYDYYSIMHYRTNAFGIGNRTTISILDGSVNANLVGNSHVLSAGDMNAVAYVYGTTQEPKPCEVKALENGQSTILNAQINTEQCFKLALPDNSKSYTVTTEGLNGDADLFVRHNDIATAQNYDCKSAGENSNEQCTANVQGGYMHINVQAYKAFDNLKLTASYEVETDPVPCGVSQLTPGTDINISIDAKNSQCFKLMVPDSAERVEFKTQSGSGDADLYIQKEKLPTLQEFDCKSAGETSLESCNMNAQAGAYFVRVFAWNKIENVKLSAKIISKSDQFETYLGELKTNTQTDIQPNNDWFEYEGGQISASLSGPDNADLELVLQRWNGNQKIWYDLDSATEPGSQETINLDVNAGYYRFKIYSWDGQSKGQYTFKLQK